MSPDRSFESSAPGSPVRAIADDQLHALSLLAHGHWLQRSIERANVLYAALDVLRPHDGATLIGLAASEFACGRPERALAALDRRALHCAPDRAYHLLRSRVLRALARMEESRRSMQDYLRLTACGHAEEA